MEYATLGWNVVGCGIVLAAAWFARSVALAGFGLDSVIEIFASVVVVWQLRGSATPDRERKAVRLIGAAFSLLALYILAQSAYTLLSGVRPETSTVGIIWLALTFVAMLRLADILVIPAIPGRLVLDVLVDMLMMIDQVKVD